MSVEHSSNCIQNHFSAPERVVLHVQRRSSDVGLGRIADFFFSNYFVCLGEKKIIENYNHINFSSCFRFHVSTGRCSYRAVFTEKAVTDGGNENWTFLFSPPLKLIENRYTFIRSSERCAKNLFCSLFLFRVTAQRPPSCGYYKKYPFHMLGHPTIPVGLCYT